MVIFLNNCIEIFYIYVHTFDFSYYINDWKSSFENNVYTNVSIEIIINVVEVSSKLPYETH